MTKPSEQTKERKTKRRFKGNKWSKPDYLAKRINVTEHQARVNMVQDIDNDRYGNYALGRRDHVTQIRYMIKKHPKYQDICGSRNNGLFILDNVPANTVLVVSRLPSIVMTKANVTIFKKKGYFFKNRHMIAKTDPTMLGNCVSVLNEKEIEEANVELLVLTNVALDTPAYGNLKTAEEGSFSVLKTTKAIAANTFALLGTYDNTKDFPYGTEEYLLCEQEAVRTFMDNVKLTSGNPGLATCKTCCEIYSNRGKKPKVAHGKFCKGNLCDRLWNDKKSKKSNKV